MPYNLLPCTQDDVPSMISIYLSSFATQENSILCFSACPPSSMEQWLTARFTRQLAEPTYVHVKAVFIAEPGHQEPGTQNGEVAAFVRYAVPHVVTPELKEREEKEKEERRIAGTKWPSVANEGACEALFGQVVAMRAKYVDVERMYGACDYSCFCLASSHRRKFPETWCSECGMRAPS